MRARRAAVAWLSVVAVVALLAPWLAGPDPAAIARGCIGGCAPGAAAGGGWLGTDGLGRDVWAQLAHGARTALLGGVAAAVAAALAGVSVGAGAAWWSWRGRRLPWWVLAQAVLGVAGVGYAVRYLPPAGVWGAGLLAFAALAGGLALATRGLPRAWAWGVRADALLLYAAEVLSSVPGLLLLLALAALAFRPGLWQLVVVYVCVRWVRFAVLALQELRDVLDRPYLRAADRGGVGARRLLGVHALPNAAASLWVEAILSVSGFIILEGTFSFLGLGLPVQQASWGRVLAQAQHVSGGWWLWVFPGVALVATVLSLQTVGRALRADAGGAAS